VALDERPAIVQSHAPEGTATWGAHSWNPQTQAGAETLCRSGGKARPGEGVPRAHSATERVARRMPLALFVASRFETTGGSARAGHAPLCAAETGVQSPHNEVVPLQGASIAPRSA